MALAGGVAKEVGEAASSSPPGGVAAGAWLVSMETSLSFGGCWSGVWRRLEALEAGEEVAGEEVELICMVQRTSASSSLKVKGQATLRVLKM